MARCTPFVRCRYIDRIDIDNNTETMFYLVNIFGHAESIATATNRNTNIARYRAHDAFIEQYSYLHGDSPTEWMFEDDFQNWIAKLQYYSFVEQRLETVLQTSCFPGIWFDRTTVGEFTISCDTEDDMLKAFHNHLEPLFEHDGEQQIVFALQAHEWTIPVIDGVMNDEALVDFIGELDLFIGEFIAILMSNELLARVIVFDGEGREKIYPWYQNRFM
ncbi:hypothetical protein RHMOL_Rhmol10G0071400 [Rhododendron molle]|uniref:Uncharacterized protein n=1 Tax=Rhododendron molle TaxID=49168 RepID=A0ACC0M0U5_RHOML|nr:hypothetical protein RHMOL_Rhmol10G0071400 [Rhododendron molle]